MYNCTRKCQIKYVLFNLRVLKFLYARVQLAQEKFYGTGKFVIIRSYLLAIGILNSGYTRKFSFLANEFYRKNGSQP